MGYRRPRNGVALSKAEKLNLLRANALYYQELATTDRPALNRKVPREAFAEVLGRVGAMVVAESARLAASPGTVREFLDVTPLPAAVAPLLPDSFRVFCLMLNSLKQWVVAELSAADCYLLGGHARELCMEAVETCVVTGEPLGSDAELHHPVRDGRPPIPLSKKGHAAIEGQIRNAGETPFERALITLRRQRKSSWAQLRRGCLDLLGTPVSSTSRHSAASARTFARKAVEAANCGYADILAWLDAKGF